MLQISPGFAGTYFGPDAANFGLISDLILTYPMLGTSTSGPEIGFAGRISADVEAFPIEIRPKSGPEALIAPREYYCITTGISFVSGLLSYPHGPILESVFLLRCFCRQKPPCMLCNGASVPDIVFPGRISGGF